MSDLISREELIRVIDHRIKYTKDARKSHTSVFVDGMKDGYARIRSDVLLMPSAQPERKKGQWVNDGKGLYKCTSCGELWLHWWAVVVPPDKMCEELRYCPQCGAEMRGQEE